VASLDIADYVVATKQAALAGMVVGTVVLVVWKRVGLDAYMYEMVPGFMCNCITISLVGAVIPQKDDRITRQFTEVVETAAGQQRR
jgi:sodium/proline symporter